MILVISISSSDTSNLAIDIRGGMFALILNVRLCNRSIMYHDDKNAMHVERSVSFTLTA